jgi:hypothetical protein
MRCHPTLSIETYQWLPEFATVRQDCLRFLSQIGYTVAGPDPSDPDGQNHLCAGRTAEKGWAPSLLTGHRASTYQYIADTGAKPCIAAAWRNTLSIQRLGNRVHSVPEARSERMRSILLASPGRGVP